MTRLRHGYTTGACAAAAAKGATLMLREHRPVEEVEIVLPRGERVVFPLRSPEIGEASASCYIVKDAGDDPDVTNGAEIHATVTLAEGRGGIVIVGGTGIGRMTKPGLAVPPGEWAINPVPRRMIEEAVREVFPCPESRVPSPGLHISISIPDGEERAKKTLNARLGIIGGLSILGTTGIVTPISTRAWTDTIDAAVDVAVACGSPAVVLSTGRTSELAAQRFLGTRDSGLGTRGSGAELPEEAFVMMGDHVAHALRSCAARGVRTVWLAAQFAKLVKIACGHGQTHVSSSEMDLRILARWLDEAEEVALAETARTAATARQVLESSGFDHRLVELVSRRAAAVAAAFAQRLSVNVLLAGYGGEMIYCRRF
jgi:cobalt-precorrin-5B (C1)-methyltransferase